MPSMICTHVHHVDVCVWGGGGGGACISCFFLKCTCMCTVRDEFIRYRIAVCDAKSKFCDAKLNVIRRKLRCKAILTAQKKMLFVCDFRACTNACTCGLCSSVLSKIFACTRFLFTCRGALDSCFFPRMPYACCFLDFRVRRFDNKLPVAFDRVRCWLIEVLLTSQLGHWSRCTEKRRLDFEKCSTWQARHPLWSGGAAKGFGGPRRGPHYGVWGVSPGKKFGNSTMKSFVLGNLHNYWVHEILNSSLALVGQSWSWFQVKDSSPSLFIHSC